MSLTLVGASSFSTRSIGTLATLGANALTGMSKIKATVKVDHTRKCDEY